MVFNLYVLEKKTHKEISEILDISVNTSKSHLNRARKKLQDILFEKAQNKEKKKTKKYLLLFIPFYFSIDRLYANSFKNFEMKTNVNKYTFSKTLIKEEKRFSVLNKLATFFIICSTLGGFFFFILKKMIIKPILSWS